MSCVAACPCSQAQVSFCSFKPLPHRLSAHQITSITLPSGEKSFLIKIRRRVIPPDQTSRFGFLSWKVFLKNGQILAEADPKQAKRYIVRPPFNPPWRGTDESDTWVAIPVTDGWLVAFDVGEFGCDIISVQVRRVEAIRSGPGIRQINFW